MAMLVSNYPNVSINTANPATEMARRDAVRRDLFEPVKEAEKSNPEKPVISDERARGAAANQSAVNLYGANGKETETQQAIEGRSERQPDQQEGDAEREPNQQETKQQEAKQQEAKQQQVEQQEQQQIQELKSRDQEVKTHEQAHATVGGQYASAPSYSYELGPDGKQYAVGGEVQIDIAPIPGDPQATIQKMQQVRSAALAPAEPSGADRRIAAEAMQRQMAAQAELVMQSAQAGKTDSASASSDSVLAEDAVGASGKETFSYSMNEQDGSAAIATPQRDTFAAGAEYAQRRNVVSSFYARATEPQSRQFSQQA